MCVCVCVCVHIYISNIKVRICNQNIFAYSKLVLVVLFIVFFISIDA